MVQPEIKYIDDKMIKIWPMASDSWLVDIYDGRGKWVKTVSATTKQDARKQAE